MVSHLLTAATTDPSSRRLTPGCTGTARSLPPHLQQEPAGLDALYQAAKNKDLAEITVRRPHPGRCLPGRWAASVRLPPVVALAQTSPIRLAKCYACPNLAPSPSFAGAPSRSRQCSRTPRLCRRVLPSHPFVANRTFYRVAVRFRDRLFTLRRCCNCAWRDRGRAVCGVCLDPRDPVLLVSHSGFLKLGFGAAPRVPSGPAGSGLGCVYPCEGHP